MSAAGGLHQPVRHQRAGGNDGIDDAAIDQFGDDQSLLGDRHGASQGHHHETLFIPGHGLQHVRRFAHLPPGESRLGHGAHQVVDASAPWSDPAAPAESAGLRSDCAASGRFRAVMIAMLHARTSESLLLKHYSTRRLASSCYHRN